MGVPDEEAYGPHWDRSAHGLVEVARAESYRGFIFVSFDPEVEDLSTYLAGARQYLDDLVDASAVAASVLNGGVEEPSWGPLEVLRGRTRTGSRRTGSSWSRIASTGITLAQRTRRTSSSSMTRTSRFRRARAR